MHIGSLPLAGLLAASLAAIPAGLAAQQSATTTDAVRVMTFNIRYGTARDGQDKWDLRAHRVMARINAFQPDILGVQEALHFQVQQLEHALPAYLSFGTYRRGGTADESCRVFVRADRFAIEDTGTFWLSPTPDKVASRGWDAVLPRICTWAVLRDRRNHSRFLFANTHFDHRGRQARLESAKLISAWSRIFQIPILLTGDFNSGESTAAMKHIRSSGLRDTFRMVKPNATQVGTMNAFRRPGREKIDHVFASSEFEVLDAAIDTSKIEGRFPSDHFPVTAVARLPGGEAPQLMPVITGKPWHIGDNPDLGALTGEKQQIVDHAIFQSRDGAWHLWACIRGTEIGRVLYAWEGNDLHQRV